MAFDREKTLQTAQKFIEKRKYDRAIAEYQKVVEHEPNDARTLLRIGDLQARLGLHPEAIATYDRVALYYAGKGFSQKAVAVLKQIAELIERHAPQLADQYSHVLPKLAQTYAELGLITDALATYDIVARRMQSRGRERDAVELIRRMVALDRQNPLPYLRLAEALCRISRVDEAIEHFESSAQLLTREGRPDDAIKVLERILHFRQETRVARVLAELYLRKGTREAGMSALSRLQLCFEADPRDLQTLILLAQAFDVIGQSSKGVEVYKEMVRIAEDTERLELRDRYLQHLLQVAPDDPQVREMAREHGVSRSGRAPGPMPGSSMPAEALSEEDIEFLDEDSITYADDVAPRDVDGPTRVTLGLAERARSGASSSEGALEQGSGGSQAAAASSATASAFLRKALVDAESFRGLKLYGKASASLRHALAAAPGSIELRAALAQVLLESGDVSGALQQMLVLARLYIERGSFPAAEAELHQVLELAPETDEARQLLRTIGAASVLDRRMRSRPAGPSRAHEEVPPSQAEHEAFELRARVSSRRGVAERAPAPDEPLPAYELDEEVGTASPAARVPTLPAAARAPSSAAMAPVRTPLPDGPLPQFSLDSGLLVASTGEDARGRLAPLARGEAAPPSERDLAPRAAPSRDSIRAALDEAEFFSARGLYHDAALILRDRLEQYPGDAALIEAIASIEPKLNTESGTRDVGRLSVPAGAAFEPDVGRSAPADELPPSRAKELRVQFGLGGATSAGPIIDADAEADLLEALEQRPEEQVDVDEVFAKFKQGVKAQISDSDSATHYDLGVAYKEMGLLADAAREFEIASIDPKRECNCLAMMGMIYRERGEFDRAAEAYVNALNAAHKTIAQEVSLYYDLGIIYEMKDDPDEAIYYFQRITRRDPGYRDVAERLRALLPRSRRFSQPARAINDDDFDRHFDELYKPE